MATTKKLKTQTKTTGLMGSVESIIRACHECGVARFKSASFEIDFSPSKSKIETKDVVGVIQPYKNPYKSDIIPEEGDSEDETFENALEETEQEMFDRLLIEDPAEYERLMREKEDDADA